MLCDNLLYTLENWRTGEIEVREYPDKILKLTLEDIIKFLHDHYGRILNFNELFFYLTFVLEGWQVYCTPFNRHHPTTKYIAWHIIDELGIAGKALKRGGCPDFLLVNWKDKSFRFVEVKASEQTLNKKQVEWGKEFSYDFFVAKPASMFEGEEGIEAEKRIVTENKIKYNKISFTFEKLFIHPDGYRICATFESWDMSGHPISVVIIHNNGIKVPVQKRFWFNLLTDASLIEKP